MNSRIPIIGLLLLSLLIITACTSNDTPLAENNSATSTPTNFIDEVPNLQESYIWSDIFTDSVITIDYPSGWFIEGKGDQLLISSTDPDNLESESDAILINVLPAVGEMLLEETDTTPESLLELSFLETLGEVEAITTSTINDNPSAYTSGNFDGNSSIIYAIQFDEGFFIVLIAIKAGDFSENEETLVLSIIESVRYESGNLNSSDE